jgi:hypothetical protein
MNYNFIFLKPIPAVHWPLLDEVEHLVRVAKQQRQETAVTDRRRAEPRRQHVAGSTDSPMRSLAVLPLARLIP